MQHFSSEGSQISSFFLFILMLVRKFNSTSQNQIENFFKSSRYMIIAWSAHSSSSSEWGEHQLQICVNCVCKNTTCDEDER